MDFFEIVSKEQALCMNSLVLAYVGDAVQSLYERQKLALTHDFKTGVMHKMASEKVNAHTQAQLVAELWDTLTEEEQEVYKRGRNSTVHHRAKNQSPSDYRKATGFETLLGYLYLTGQTARLKQLLECKYENRG